MSGFRGINGASPRKRGVPSIYSTTRHSALHRHADPDGAGHCLCLRRGFMDKLVGGFPRSLSRGQIQKVLRWHRSWVRFRQRQGTLASLAKAMELTVHELQRALQGDVTRLGLSVAQRKCIAQWQARRRRFRSRHPSAASLAESLGISRSTLFLCISKKGAYKTRPRQERGSQPSSSLGRRRAEESAAMRSALLRDWRTVDLNTPSARVSGKPRVSRKGGAS